MNTLIDLLKEALLWCLNEILDLLIILIELLVGLVLSVLNSILSLLPDPPSVSGSVVEFLAFGNTWLPVDLTFQLLLVWFSVKSSVFTVRLVSKLIPTLG